MRADLAIALMALALVGLVLFRFGWWSEEAQGDLAVARAVRPAEKVGDATARLFTRRSQAELSHAEQNAPGRS